MEATAAYPTWAKYVVMKSSMDRMRVREKRKVFNLMRLPGMSSETFLPAHGFTLGEFSAFQILDATRRPLRLKSPNQ